MKTKATTTVPDFNFNQEHLDKLIGHRVTLYKTHEATHNTAGAVVSVYGDYPHQFLERIVGMGREGYTLSVAEAHLTPGFCRAYMVKSEAEQEADIAKIKTDTEAEYRANLEIERQKWLDAEVERLAAEAVEKERAAEEAKMAKMREQRAAQLRKDLEAQMKS